ncbi:MAG TPA: winged helix-turn-helix domain-containing protein [Candidatus Acidoferrales bacterium]|nr:winged helix-turn-helix domain-containing protein [Candidatus Acidoferrales bacterium]
MDFRAAELYKAGHRLRLQEQPFKVLTMLLERPGEIVTREELREQLWPADTFVDFDHGLNSAVARLREALYDSAEKPKYIDTVARRGYRFIGTVEKVASADVASQIGLPETSPGSRTIPESRAIPEERTSRKSRIWAATITAAAVACVLAFYVWEHSFASSPAKRTIDSIAVLPFEEISGAAETGYLAEGITESAIDHLSALGDLKVISLRSVLPYRGRQLDPRQVGRELGVRSVMTGRIDFRGDCMRVIAELVDTADGTHIWGGQYDRQVSDIPSVQEEIAREIAVRLERRLNSQQQVLLRKRYTENFEAWQTYLRGRYYWNRRFPEDLKRGITYFEQAIDADPGNALAYAGLADSYFVRAVSGNVSMNEGMFKAKAAALKALELDDSLAEAHTSLAQISSTYERNWVLAESEYKRAIALNANYSTGHHYYATFLMAMGRHDEAMAEMKKAQELDPLSPIIATFIGKALYFAGKNDESIAEYQKVLATDPAFPVARTFLIHSLEQAGRFDEVIAQRTIIAAQFGNSVEHTNALRQRYKSEGVRGYWKSRIAEMGGKLEDKPEAALETASLYARLGDKDRAFSFLERALEYHDLWAEYLKVDAQWENLHGDSRYELALKHAGLN